MPDSGAVHSSSTGIGEAERVGAAAGRRSPPRPRPRDRWGRGRPEPERAERSAGPEERACWGAKKGPPDVARRTEPAAPVDEDGRAVAGTSPGATQRPQGMKLRTRPQRGATHAGSPGRGSAGPDAHGQTTRAPGHDLTGVTFPAP
ncbi:hypothetical protein ACFPM0_15220 [Pseudonocardia sulfidoxydans]|uniref:hypothetical protein n=1 Tax=Pseudonocardia sulfidoxydans TaxID=54011 RepID=UPI0036239986